MSQEQGTSDQILALPGFNDEPVGAVGDSLPPWWRRRSTIIGIAILLLIVLAAAILIPILNRPRPVTYQYQNITRGSLALTVSATGPIQSGVYNLIFSGSGGKISQIYVKVGQTVKKGDKLAQLDATALQDAVNQAQASYNAALVSYDNAANIYAKTTGQTQASVSAAQTAVANSTSSQSATQGQSQTSVASAQQTLSNDQDALSSVQKTSQDSIDAAQQKLDNDQKALQNAQSQSGDTNSVAQQAVNNAQNTLNNDNKQEQADQAALTNCLNTPAPTPTPIPPTPTTASTTALTTAFSTAASDCSTQQAAVTKDQSTVQADQNALATAQKQLNSTQTGSNTSVDNAQAAVNADQKALTAAQDQAQSDIQAAQNKIAADQAALSNAQANAAASNTTAQNSVNTAQSGLKTSQASGSSSEASSLAQLTTAQAQLKTAQVTLTTAQHNLDNALLTAPHSGIVSTINGTVGSAPGVPPNASTSSTTTAGSTFIQIVDVSSMQVQANINETDTANLKAGDPVSFTVNAYGNRAFAGTVSAISPNGQTVSNVVTFPVTVDIDMSKKNIQDATLLPGMTANITVTVLKRDNILTIPVNAINFARLETAGASTATASNSKSLITRQEANTAMSQARQMLTQLINSTPSIVNDDPLAAYVLEQSNGKFIAKPVVLGLTDGTIYEVLSGLNENETIVVGSSAGGIGGITAPAGGASGGGAGGGVRGG